MFLWGYASPYLTLNVNPMLVSSLDCRATEVQSGAHHICVLTSAGRVLTWGCGEQGQLGLGDKENKSFPWLVKDIFEYRITMIACGAYHTLALADTGELFAWGDNQKYAIGYVADRREILSPVLIPDFKDKTVLQLFAAGFTSGVLTGKKIKFHYQIVHYTTFSLFEQAP